MATGRFGDEHHEAEATGTSTSTNDIFDALNAAQRRCVLRYLLGSDEVVTLEELAEWVAARDDAGDASDPERVAIALHHGHLPKLTDAGLVAYDPATRTVECRAELAAVASSLTVAGSR